MNPHTLIDERHAIGANNPPEPIETEAQKAFNAIKVDIEDLYTEAQNWCDGEPIITDEQAEKVEQLLDMICKSEAAADAQRVKENEPFDTGKAEVQARYSPLISDTKSVKGLTVKARAACLAVLGPWRQRKEQERIAAAEAARLEAQAKAQAAVEALRQADVTNLADTDRAEEMVREATQAQKAADRAERGVTKGSGLRSVWTPTLTDPKAALLHYAQRRPDDLKAFLLKCADEDVRAGVRTIPGFVVDETRVPV